MDDVNNMGGGLMASRLVNLYGTLLPTAGTERFNIASSRQHNFLWRVL